VTPRGVPARAKRKQAPACPAGQRELSDEHLSAPGISGDVAGLPGASPAPFVTLDLPLPAILSE